MIVFLAQRESVHNTSIEFKSGVLGIYATKELALQAVNNWLDEQTDKSYSHSGNVSYWEVVDELYLP